MPLPLLLPLAPLLLEGASAAAVVVTIGTAAHLAQGFSEFRGGPRSLPPVTGQEQEATLQEMVRDAAAGARIPVGFVPPEPQGPGPAELLALAAAAAAGAWDAWQQLSGAAQGLQQQAGNAWDWLNRPRLPDRVVPLNNLTDTQTLTVNSSPRFCLYQVQMKGLIPSNGGWYEDTVWGIGWPSGNDFPAGKGYRITGVDIRETGQDNAPDLWGKDSVHLEVRVYGVTAAGITGCALYFRQFARGSGSAEVIPYMDSTDGWVTTINTTAPLPRTEKLPDVLPLAMPAGAFPVIPAPARVAPSLAPPQTEAFSPTPAPGPESIDPEADTWKPTPLPVPITPLQPMPANPTQTTAAGLPIAQPPARPRTTAVGSHFINGTEIPAPSARADMQGIATELQRVEKKLELLSKSRNPQNQGGNWIDDLFQVLWLTQQLYDMLTQDVEEKVWSITAPCNKDANGNPSQLSYDIGAADYMPALLARMDALMDAFGKTQSWRKPVCKGGVTNNVTITAYSVDS